MAAAAGATHSFGLIWIDSISGLLPGDEAQSDRSILARALGLHGREGSAQPQLSPENVVIVGLLEAELAEAAI